MDAGEAQEALRWNQGKVSLIGAIGEWAALGAKVRVGMDHGTIRGYICAYGEDWICVQTETKRVFIPRFAIEIAQATLGNHRPGSFKDQRWIGCLRAFVTSEERVGMVLRSGKHVEGVLAVVAQDHVRLVQSQQDDGTLGPIIPLDVITCLWQQIPS